MVNYTKIEPATNDDKYTIQLVSECLQIEHSF
jgi:hypothetical protein